MITLPLRAARAPDGPLGAVAEKVKELVGAGPAGSTESRRTLPVFGTADELEAAWRRPSTREVVLEGIPVDVDALTMSFGAGRPGWGNEATLHVQLDAPLPHLAADAIAGKILRRFKSLVETGEVPTTAHNPSARNDDGTDEHDGAVR